MAKDKLMQTTQAELKAVAKTAGAALARSGHPVPHTAVLNALAAALNRRDWNKLKAAVQSPQQAMAPGQSPSSDIPAPGAPALNEKSLHETLAAVRSYIETPGDLTREEVRHLLEDVTVEMHRLESRLPVVVKGDNAYRLVDGSLQSCAVLADGRISGEVEANEWYEVSEGDAQSRDARTELEAASPELARASVSGPVLVGDEVSCKFWTDDREFEVSFDARAFMAQASDKDLTSIIEVGYSGDYATDAIGEFEATRNPSIAQAFEYLDIVNRSNKRDSIGFEVRVTDVPAFLRWMAEFRRPALAKCLCSRAGIVLREIKDAEREDGATWGWEECVAGQTVDESTNLFQTQEDAAIAAYLTKNLLQQAIDGDL